MAGQGNGLVNHGGESKQFVSPFEIKDYHGNSLLKVADGSDFTSGTLIGLQNKPSSSKSGGTQSVVGAQISPRYDAGVTAGVSVVGVQAQPLLKDGGLVLSGDFGGFEADLTDNAQSGNTVGGDIYALRGYLNMASQTVTGEVCLLKADAAGGAQQWTSFAKLPDDAHMASSTLVSATAAGYIKVKIGSATRYIALTSGTPA